MTVNDTVYGQWYSEPALVAGRRLPRALGYVRVSTDDQADPAAGIAAQRRTIVDECERRGWQLVDVIVESDLTSGQCLEREGLQRALGIMDQRKDRRTADVLVVAKLNRLSRSLLDGAKVIARAQRKGWGLVAFDLGLDTTSTSGEFVACTLLAVAQYERDSAEDNHL
jgi:DNA invertase Pin-like site-specific DNA recombinase